jgi:sterol desaturase/sphingolipid hydroxylase (fatty acid hydroxylase superfamily)
MQSRTAGDPSPALSAAALSTARCQFSAHHCLRKPINGIADLLRVGGAGIDMDWLGLKDFLIACLIFVPLERLVAMHPEQKILRRDWRTDLICLFLSGFLIKLGLAILVVGVIVAAGWLVPASFQAKVAAQPYWLQIVQMIILGDVGFYCAHRAFHAIPWLWKFHAIHHSIEELDWLAAARVHPVDQIVTKGASLLPIFALGFSEIAIGMYVVLYYWQSFLIHANVRVHFGPLRWVLASPEFHHWHHSNHSEAQNKNFAGQLPALDLLWGTLHMPRGKVPTRYGTDEPVPKTYVSQLLYPFRSAEKRHESRDAKDNLPLIESSGVRPMPLRASSWPAPAVSIPTGARAER